MTTLNIGYILWDGYSKSTGKPISGTDYHLYFNGCFPKTSPEKLSLKQFSLDNFGIENAFEGETKIDFARKYLDYSKKNNKKRREFMQNYNIDKGICYLLDIPYKYFSDIATKYNSYFHSYIFATFFREWNNMNMFLLELCNFCNDYYIQNNMQKRIVYSDNKIVIYD